MASQAYGGTKKCPPGRTGGGTMSRDRRRPRNNLDLDLGWTCRDVRGDGTLSGTSNQGQFRHQVFCKQPVQTVCQFFKRQSFDLQVDGM